MLSNMKVQMNHILLIDKIKQTIKMYKKEI